MPAAPARSVIGNTLQDRLIKEPRLAPREAVRIGAALARSIDQMHRRGTPVAPLGPASVILQGTEVRLSETAPVPSGDGAGRAVVGEPENGGGGGVYPSPEEVSGSKPDERTDIYRLGALMYQMLTGSPPPAPEPVHLLPTSGRGRPSTGAPSVHAIRRDVSRPLDAAITRALAWNPQDRYARALQFADVMEDALAQRLDHEPHSDRPSQMAIVDSWEFREEELRGERQRKTRPLKRGAVALLILLTIVLAAILLRKTGVLR